MNSITTDLLEELVTYNNQINCVKETISSVQQSELLIINHIENGSTTESLVEPFEHLFKIVTQKPHTDIEYVENKKPAFTINIGQNCNDVNVYDLDTFLQAIVPEQVSLIEILEEQCNMYPQYMPLIKHLHLLRTSCTRPICQGRILAGVKFTSPGRNDIPFPIAHPPFVYEIKKLLRRGNEALTRSYMCHLTRYLTNPIETDCCILCLTFDLYCKNTCELSNVRLFFLEQDIIAPIEATLDVLYDTHIETVNKAKQCTLFDEILSNITLLCLPAKNGEQTSYVVRYCDIRTQVKKLYL